MRWKTKRPEPVELPKHKVGDKMIKERFLWWPQKINGFYYWLEPIEVEYTWKCTILTEWPMVWSRGWGWVETRIIEP